MLMAARRELREELSLEVESLGKLLFVAHDPGSDFLVNFIETIVLGKPQLNEHADLRWVRKHEFRQLNFAPSDERFINFQINGLY